MCSILGMSLLSHLVEDRLPLFHCELEFLTATQRRHKNIQYCVSLEQYLMMGSYDQVSIMSDILLLLSY